MGRLREAVLQYLRFFLPAIACVIITCSSALSGSAALPPLLLSLDVEKDSDVEALSILNLQEPATYFVTGKFAETFPETVRNLSLRGTIGSHSYEHLRMKDLEIERVREDLLASSRAIEAATGTAPVWFRAPFLEFSEPLLKTAAELGFRYDSSMSERWVHQQAMNEFPISINSTGRILFSDYNIFSTYGLDAEMALELLRENYLERVSSGRPFIFLLHPSIIVEQKELLYRFIDFVKQQGGSCMTFDQYLNSFSSKQNTTVGVHLDPQAMTVTSEKMVGDFKTLGVTDVFVDMHGIANKGQKGHSTSPPAVLENLVLLIKTLRQNDLNVHASISALFHPTPEAHGLPEDLMTDRQATALPGWRSPSSASTHRLLSEHITLLLKTYPLDGIHLENLSYPGLEYDYSPSALEQFVKDTSLMLSAKDPTTILTDYYNEWISWRITQLAEIAQSAAAALAHGDDSVQLSASLDPAALMNYRAMELSGQDYRLLADVLDFIVMKQHALPTSEPLPRYYDFNVLSRAMVGDRPILVSYDDDSGLNWTAPDFTRFIEDLSFSSSANLGAVLPEYNSYISTHSGTISKQDNLYRLIGKSRSFNKARLSETAITHPKKKSPEALQVSLSSSISRELKESAAGFANIQERGTWPIKKILPVFLGTALVIVSIILIASYRYRQSSLAKSLDFEKTAVIDWQRMDRSILEGDISGSLVHAVAKHLRNYDPVKVSKYRVALILSVVANSEKKLSVDDLINSEFDLPGWHILAMSHLKEALMHNYLQLSQDKVIITSKGTQEYNDMKKHGFDPKQWVFTEKRLHEYLVVACPYCSAENTAHWYWPNFTCTSCNQDISFRECHTAIKKKSTAVELDQHQFS